MTYDVFLPSIGAFMTFTPPQLADILRLALAMPDIERAAFLRKLKDMDRSALKRGIAALDTAGRRKVSAFLDRTARDVQR